MQKATAAAVKPGPGPVVSVGKSTTVLDTVKAMVEGKVGAAVIQEGAQLLGVFTERDVVRKVVLRGLDPKSTPVSEVMTRSVITVRENTDRSSCLKLMNQHHIRHLPVVDGEGRVLAIVSIRQMLRAEVQDLQQTVWELVAETTMEDGVAGG